MANPYFTKGVLINKEFIKTSNGKEPNLLQITIKLINPEEKPFRPGQFCTFRVAEGIFRAYSIASDYKEVDKYSFLISCGHEGIGANYFRNLNINDEVVFLGPNGHFKVIVPVAKEIYFFATGTGIAPFVPMIEFLIDNNCSSKIHLIHGFRDETNIDFYTSIHKKLADKCPNFSSQVYLSKPATNSESFTKGRITDYIKNLDLSKHQDTQFYLCGHPDMINESVEYLINAYFPQDNVMYEAFTSPGAYGKI